MIANCLIFSLENKGKLNEELKRADAVVLTYACNQQSTLSRLSSYWLPELRRLEVCSLHNFSNMNTFFNMPSCGNGVLLFIYCVMNLHRLRCP